MLGFTELALAGYLAQWGGTGGYGPIPPGGLTPCCPYRLVGPYTPNVYQVV